MTRVLILAYDFPPYVSVGGLRPYSWFKYLCEYGIYPIVITRQWSNKYGSHLDYIAPSTSLHTITKESKQGTIIQTPYFPNLANRIMLKYGDSKFKLLRKMISAFYEFVQFFFFVGPKSRLYFAAKDYLEKNKVDAIVASGDPFILFKYASKLSESYNIPWIADYRDPWVQDKSRNKYKITEIWEAFLEKKYLANVSSITTVSTFLKKQITSLITNKQFYIIPNGYNPEAVKKVINIPQNNSSLRIAFVGTVYKWHPIDRFLQVSCEFVKKTDDAKFQIKFYGINIENEIKDLIQSKYQELIPYIDITPKIPNEELLQKLVKNNVFLLFNDYSFLGTKIFDYLALNRKIILCFSNDTEAMELKRKYYYIQELESESCHLQEDLIKKTKSGIVIEDACHLTNVLEQLYLEFKHQGFIACNSVDTWCYSRKVQVQKLAEIIKNTTIKSQSAFLPTHPL